MADRERALSQEAGRDRAGSGARARSGSVIGRIVLVAVDSSDNAKAAFDYYIDNIHKSDDMIVLVHCPETPKLPSFKFKSGIAPPVDDWKKVLDDMNTKTRMIEEEYEGTLVAKKLKYKIRGEAHKKPGEGIVSVAEEEKADLIVIGTRGLGAVKRVFMGSVSEHVVRYANRPTLVVPQRQKADVKE